MRLTEYQIKVIKELTRKYFGINSKIYLYGSRVDDNKKGGDIDLYLETDLENENKILDNKLKLLVEIKKKIGNRKIDIAINNFKSEKIIYRIAKEEGICL